MSAASVKVHPINRLRIVFPLGLWGFALVCDVAFLLGGSPVWWTAAAYGIAGGVAGAALAAVPCLIELVAARAKAVAPIVLWHVWMSLGAIVLFGADLYLRALVRLDGGGLSAVIPINLSSLGVVLIGLSGWLGGELVYRGIRRTDERQRPGGPVNSLPLLAVSRGARS